MAGGTRVSNTRAVGPGTRDRFTISAIASRVRFRGSLLACGPAVLRGKIDLLYRAADGTWHVVDYKSDQVAGEQAGDHAEGYKLQMLAYFAAAARQLPAAPAEARLYFLRPAATVDVVAPQDTQNLTAPLAEAASRLLAARRSATFDNAERPLCKFCPYATLCGR